jgi:hypothetical protein
MNNGYHKELLLEIVNRWSNEQLQGYIIDLESRLENTRIILKELYAIKKKRNKKRIMETGVRNGH